MQLQNGGIATALRFNRMRREKMLFKIVSPWALFSLYIVFLTLLPAGSIFGINVKIIVFVPLLVVALKLLVQEDRLMWQFSFMAAIIAIFTIWAIRSLMSPVYADLAFSQYKDTLTTFAGCLFIRLFTFNEARRKAFVKLCINTVAAGCILKLLIFVYSLWTGTSVSDIVDRASIIFGVKLMSIDIGDIGGRLQFPSDNILPICIFAVLALRKRLQIGNMKSLLIVTLLLGSSLYTFSRYIWGTVVCAVIAGMLVSRKDKMHLVYLGATAAITTYFFKLISTLIAFRFSSALTGSSDIQRVWQIVALKKFFWEAPFFGHGLGSFDLQFVRSVELPYAYEVQILALAGQFGMIGMGILSFLLANYYRKVFFFRRGTRTYQVFVIFQLVGFIGAGLFNPCLLVSMSAVSYGLIFVLFSLAPSEENTNHLQLNTKASVDPLPSNFQLA